MKKILLYLVVLIASIGHYVGLYFFYLPDLARSTFEDKRDSLETSIKRQIKDAWNNKNALLYFKDYGRALKKKEILDYARNNFKEDAGIVQQHLFYNVREGLI